MRRAGRSLVELVALRRSLVELVALRRVAPRAAAQSLPSLPAAEKPGEKLEEDGERKRQYCCKVR
jgi:hypothetical protein